MKDLRILALATVLALGFTLSAQAQTQNTTGADQYTTRSTDQTALVPAMPENSGMSTQQSQSAAATTSMSSETDSNKDHERWTQDGKESEQLRQRYQDLKNDSGAN